MPNPTPLGQVNTKPAEPDKSIDPDFPSAIISSGVGGIDEPSAGYEGKQKPDFVRQDDENFTGG